MTIKNTLKLMRPHDMLNVDLKLFEIIGNSFRGIDVFIFQISIRVCSCSKRLKAQFVVGQKRTASSH
jgi:hypothetical protein